MVRAKRPQLIPMKELMPPEAQYNPSRSFGGGVLTTFFVFFGAAFALIWFSASVMPILLLMTGYFARAFVMRAAHANAVQKNQSAVNLLNAGRVDEAAALFDQLTSSERRSPAHAVYVFNRAVAFVLQGRPRRAFSLFNAVRKSRAFTFGFSSSYLPLLHVELGTCLALIGELEEARRHRDRALKMLDGPHRGRLVFFEALLLVREGRLPEADHLIRRRWHDAEAVLRVPTLRGLRVIHAFVLRRLNGSRSEARAVLERLRPHRPGEFDWIAAEWPEFRAFLREERL
jgi:tetratricopeptide (TPR) repeat protein